MEIGPAEQGAARTGTGNKRVMEALDRETSVPGVAEDQVTWGGARVSLYIWVGQSQANL